jgi:hypothetical protein
VADVVDQQEDVAGANVEVIEVKQGVDELAVESFTMWSWDEMALACVQAVYAL